MDNRKIQKAAEELLRPVVEGLGYEFVDLRIVADRGRTVLQLFADKPGGITLDDCVRLSREVGPHLEVADLVPYSYNLEVSSPGLQRPVKKLSDAERFSGQRINLTMEKPVDGRKRFKGTIRGTDGEGRIIIEIDGTEFRLPWSDVGEARLDPDMPFKDRVGKR